MPITTCSSDHSKKQQWIITQGFGLRDPGKTPRGENLSGRRVFIIYCQTQKFQNSEISYNNNKCSINNSETYLQTPWQSTSKAMSTSDFDCTASAVQNPSRNLCQQSIDMTSNLCLHELWINTLENVLETTSNSVHLFYCTGWEFL